MILLASRISLLAACAIGLSAAASIPVAPSCHLEIKSVVGDFPMIRCVPLGDDCSNCGNTGICTMTEATSGAWDLWYCACEADDGSFEFAACYAPYMFDGGAGVGRLGACLDNCCDQPKVCDDQTLQLWFANWTDPCECKLLP